MKDRRRVFLNLRSFFAAEKDLTFLFGMKHSTHRPIQMIKKRFAFRNHVRASIFLKKESIKE